MGSGAAGPEEAARKAGERRRAAPGPGQTKTGFWRTGLQARGGGSCPVALVLPGPSGSPLLVFHKPGEALNQQKCVKAQRAR